MQQEVESKYIIEDPIQIREKLVGHMAICTQPERLIQWYRYDVVDSETKRLGGHVELKVEEGRVIVQFLPLDPQVSKGVELTVSSFETAHMFLQAVGMQKRRFQEKKRETWEIDNVKIHIDHWPWLDPIVIVENESADILERLGLEDKQKTNDSIEKLYISTYDVDPSVFMNMPELKFMKRPDWV